MNLREKIENRKELAKRILENWGKVNPQQVSDERIRQMNQIGYWFIKSNSDILIKLQQTRKSDMINYCMKKFEDRTMSEEEYRYFQNTSIRKIKKDIRRGKFDERFNDYFNMQS